MKKKIKDFQKFTKREAQKTLNELLDSMDLTWQNPIM